MREVLCRVVFAVLAVSLQPFAAFGQATLTPSTLSFGNQVVNVASSTKTAILKDTQTVPLTIFGITISGGTAPADYAWGGNCPISPNTLGAGKSCSITVTLTPSELGSRTGTLTVTDSATTSPQTVTLSGTGVEPVTLSASSLSFGTAAVGNTSATKSVTLTNHEKTTLTFNSVASNGDFAIASNTCGASIGAGATCNVDVTFSPTATGTRDGTLSFTDSATNSPQTVSLSGTGSSPITISPTSLTFASTTVSTTSAAKTVTLTNNLTTSLAVSTPVASGDFSVASNTCGFSLGAGLKCTIGVTFTPTEVGTRSGSLTVSYGAFGSPSVVNLTGTGNVTGLTSITVTPANPSIPSGTTQQFVATGHFKNGSTDNLTTAVAWTSSLPGVATISATGLASGVAQGTSTVTAALDSITGSTTLTVTPSSFTIGGTITGLAGSGLVLQDNGGNNLTIAGGSTSFMFSTSIVTGGTYSVAVLTQPTSPAQTCAVSNGSGTAANGNITNVVVSCTTNIYSIGGTITGLSGSGLVLQDNGGNNLTVTVGATSFMFSAGIASGSTYSVTVLAQPTSPAQTCTASNGSGTVTNGNVTNVMVTCTAVLVSIAVTPNNATVPQGRFAQFTATGTYSDGTTQNLTSTATWSSSNTAVATINSSGLATSVGAGSATITATSGTISGSATFNTGIGFAYVANYYSNSVSAYTINASTGGLAAVAGSPFAAGTSPWSVVVDPTGKFVYVANNSSNSVSAYTIDVNTGELTAVAGSPFAAGTSPYSVVVDPTGKFVYVANNSSNSVSAYTINASTGALTAVAGSPFAAGSCPISVAVDPVGSFVYVANECSYNVSAYTINAGTGALTAVAGSPFAAGSGPYSVVVDPTGSFVYVANADSNSVSAFTITAGTGALTAVAGSPFATGSVPFSVTVDPTGNFVYVANRNSSSISAYIIDLGTGALDAGSGSPFSSNYPVSITTTTGATVSSAATLVSLQMTPANPSILSNTLGLTQQLTAVGTYSDGSTQFLTASVSWSSSNTGVATINSTGLATSTGYGDTTITVTLGSVSGSTTLTVSSAALVSIAVAPASPTIAVGVELPFTATGTYSDGTTQNLTTTATWSSSNTTVATINSSGLATGVAPGQTTVQASSSGVIGSTTLTIQQSSE
ncbi:MAG: choice-of-anchor D domain-containing protein [Terriglobales bacterium]